jgi:hypothetical protein
MRNLNVPVDDKLYAKMLAYKEKIGAKTWQGYFDITSSDAEGDVEANILGVTIKIGDSKFNYEIAGNAFTPVGRHAKTFVAPELLQVTFNVNDYVYAFSPSDPQRYRLINKLIRR